ncbi:hypothetical protein BH09PAT2_BH09PAT2_02030 [soil metagenome]
MIKTGIACIIIGIGCFVYAGTLYAQRTNPKRLEFNEYHIQQPVISGKILPSRLVIPSANIDLPLVPSSIKDGEWETTDQGVSYLKGGTLPGDRGNSIMYGHNFENLLGPLIRVKTGDDLTVKFSNGEEKTFVVAGIMTVTPDQTHILNDTSDRRITLYTCTGFLDSKRLVIVAIFKK